MKYLSARNVTRNTELGLKIRLASSLIERGVGLLTTPSLAAGDGMWIRPCTSIHTFFMRFPIDALFVDANGDVLGVETLVPWRISRWYRKSQGVLELAAGSLVQSKTQVGDHIEMKDVG